MKKGTDAIVYSLNVEDIQTVAREELERELTSKEIEKIEDTVAENIDWYGAILDAINTKLLLKTTRSDDN